MVQLNKRRKQMKINKNGVKIIKEWANTLGEIGDRDNSLMEQLLVEIIKLDKIMLKLEKKGEGNCTKNQVDEYYNIVEFIEDKLDEFTEFSEE
jgi:predicted secreted acid phosphatase